MSSSPPVRSLTIYLLKEEVKTPAQALRSDVSLDSFQIDMGHGSAASLHVQHKSGYQPRWVSFCFGYCSPPLPPLYNASTSAVLLVNHSGRSFAVTFGYGRSLLALGSWEESFGLKVTLNSIRPESIRSVESKTFDAMATHTLTQTTRAGQIADFGLDIEQDLLRSVTGEPEDPGLGKRLTGIDALHATAALTLQELPALLHAYVTKYADTTYKENYSFIDHIREVRDASKIAELDEEMIAKCQLGTREGIWLAQPEILDMQDFGGFRYGTSRRSPVYADMDLSAFLSTLSDAADVTLDLLRSSRIGCLGAAQDIATREWSVRRCLNCEINDGEATFLLSNGKWYRVDTAFVDDVNAGVAQIRESAVILPPIGPDTSEAIYNESVAAANPQTFALMDRQLVIHGGGRSSIEFCDLLSHDAQLIHVKRYHGAGALSHLFAQGVNSAELFLADTDFRDKVRKLLPPGYEKLVPADRPDPKGYEVVFAISSKSTKPLATSLPFFAKLSLKNTARRLASFGLKTSLRKIDVARSTSAKPSETATISGVKAERGV